MYFLFLSTVQKNLLMDDLILARKNRLIPHSKRKRIVYAFLIVVEFCRELVEKEDGKKRQGEVNAISSGNNFRSLLILHQRCAVGEK